MNHAINSGLVAAALLTPISADAAAIALFDFNDAWKGAKETDFSVVAGNSLSVDADANSLTSQLSNSGFNDAGYNSFVLNDVFAGTSIFSTSTSGVSGMNLGGANGAAPVNYISFTVTPATGFAINYESLTLYSDTNAAGDEYKIQLAAIDGAGAEVVLGVDSYTPGATANEPAHLVTFDFADFDSTNVTEWRLYAYDTIGSNNAVRFDDITLNGTTSAIPEPSSVALIGLSCLALLRRRRR